MSGVSQKEAVRVLSEVSLFRGLTKRQTMAIAKLVDQEQFEPGAVLVKESESGVRLLVIRTGTAAVIQRANSGGPSGRRISTLGPGDLVGELSLFDGHPTSASVVAETPIDALVLYRTRFNKLLQSTPQLYPRLVASMAQKMRAMDRRHAEIA